MTPFSEKVVAKGLFCRRPSVRKVFLGILFFVFQGDAGVGVR